MIVDSVEAGEKFVRDMGGISSVTRGKGARMPCKGKGGRRGGKKGGKR